MLLNLLTLHCYSLEVLILWTSLGVNFNVDRYFGFSKKVPVVALASQPARKGWVLAFGLGIGMGDCECRWSELARMAYLSFPPPLLVGLYSLVYLGLCL